MLLLIILLSGIAIVRLVRFPCELLISLYILLVFSFHALDS